VFRQKKQASKGLPDFVNRVTIEIRGLAISPSSFCGGFREMPRNWRSVLLFALALAIQALAPAAANFAMARPSGDLRSSIILCLQTGGSAGDRQQLPGHHDRQRDDCPLCQISCSGVAPLEARPNFAGLAPVQWTALAWTVADRALPAPRHEYSHPARAPPVFS
jgi:hypothetical protein